jgi:hypothetical protein
MLLPARAELSRSTTLEAYIKGAGLDADPKGPQFRTAVGKSDALTRQPMRQADAYRMIRRRAKAAGIHTKIGNHTFRRWYPDFRPRAQAKKAA